MVGVSLTDPGIIALVAFAFTLAGLIKGMVGLGLPSVVMGVLSLAMSPAQAASLLVLPSFATNVWQLAVGPGLLVLLRRLAWMLVGVVIGVASGSGLMTGPWAQWASVGLGLSLVAYATLGLAQLRMHVPPRWERWLGFPVGFTSGVITAATGVFVVPAVPYIQALELDRDSLIQALGIAFTVSTFSLGLSLLHTGVMQGAAAGASLLALLPAIVGMVAGTALRKRANPVLFRKVFFLALWLLGAYLAARTLAKM